MSTSAQPSETLRDRWQYGRLAPMPEVVPKGWDFVNITDVARLESGHTPSRRHPEYWDAGIPWLSLHDSKSLDRAELHKTAQTISALGLANSSARLLPAGTVAFSRTATVGKVTILGCEMATSQDFANYVCGPRLSNRYLLHLLRFLQPEWRRLMAGSTHNTIYMPVFENLQILLPPLAEQRKIATIVSSVDNAIESTQAVVGQLQIVKRAITAELLSNGIPHQHTEMKPTIIGQLPAGWEVARLGDCLREPIKNGYSPICPTVPTGRWILHLGAVTFDGFNPSARKPAPVSDKRLESATLDHGDVLVSRSNTRERVGLAGVYRGIPADAYYPDLLMRVRTAASLEPAFLELVLLSPRVRTLLSSSARGTSESMVKIDRGILSGVPIQLPSPNEQRAILAAVNDVVVRIGVETDRLAVLRVLKSALLTALLTGEIRVPLTPETP